MEEAAGEPALAPRSLKVRPGDQMQAAPLGGEHARHRAAAADPLRELALFRPERSPFGRGAAIDTRPVERSEFAWWQLKAHAIRGSPHGSAMSCPALAPRVAAKAASKAPSATNDLLPSGTSQLEAISPEGGCARSLIALASV